jgi:uncharacterized SAM-dependent methyltransferase
LPLLKKFIKIPILEKLVTRIKGFISYARNDGGDFARHLKKHCDEKQYDVFLDTSSLSVGARWKDMIESQIDDSDFFVLIITASVIDSTEVKDEFSLAINKRKLLMLFKHRSVRIDDLEKSLKDRNLHEFDTKEDLLRTFNETFREIDELLLHDLSDPFVVNAKLKTLKEEFDTISNNALVATIRGYADDNFIPIITFLRKSPVFYADEVKAIEQILVRVITLSQTLGENQDTFGELFTKSDTDMLKSNMAGYLDYLLGCFIRNTPEMRKQEKEHAEVAMVRVEPLPTETRDFLNISVDRHLTENRKRELFKRDIENQKIDIRFLFLEPDSIDLWFKMMNLAIYKFQQVGRELVAINSNELVDIMLQNSEPESDHLDFISLGVGAAIKDYYVLKTILEKMPKESEKRINYVPIDYSIGILQKTMDFLDELMELYPNRLHIEGILGDFFQLVRYSDKIQSMSKSPKVFALFGNIFGNVDEDSIMDVITRTMNSNDLFLLEVDLIDGRTDDELKIGYGSDETTKSFLLKPIVNYFKAENKYTKSKIEDYRFEIKVQEMGRVQGSKTVVTSAYYGQKDHEKIELVNSHKYELEPLLNYMYERWRLHHIKTYKEQNACLLLLGKRRVNVEAGPPQPPQTEAEPQPPSIAIQEDQKN